MDIRKEDLWPLESTEECEFLAKKLEKVWNPLAGTYNLIPNNFKKSFIVHSLKVYKCHSFGEETKIL
jgi:hypothetical protein